ncbi:3-oxo-5-alpha-steroid 4-dehydrogenase 1 [Saguinus oedipus]|uniref:3-oxo-5-alpha-steroid 4-dehydrogenase 1 n=1 Tax=Saguinus oedipus TaxID=9490 RepID=A0ABQ9W9V4_SAGOE|nr:3-oxo-5-alpha-steroid 4-dehydrogenase 1 [Saguinus oedipus]
MATTVAEERLLAALVYLQCAAGCLLLGLNQHRNSPYGRQAAPTCRPRVPARVAWAVQELPSLALPLYQCASESAPRLRDAPNCILLAMFLVHYEMLVCKLLQCTHRIPDATPQYPLSAQI